MKLIITSMELFSDVLTCQSIVSPFCAFLFNVSCCVGDWNSILKSITQNENVNREWNLTESLIKSPKHKHQSRCQFSGIQCTKIVLSEKEWLQCFNFVTCVRCGAL